MIVGVPEIEKTGPSVFQESEAISALVKEFSNRRTDHLGRKRRGRRFLVRVTKAALDSG